MGEGAAGPLPQERYRGERMRLAFRVAPYARRVLVAGDGTALFCGILKRALGIEVVALEAAPDKLDLASAVADQALRGDVMLSPAPFPLEHLDMAVLQDIGPWVRQEDALLSWVAPLLKQNGPGLVALMDISQAQRIADAASATGLLLYKRWMEAGECVLRLVPPGFDPLVTAEEQAAAGHFDWAYNELMEIPEERLEQNPALAATVHASALEYLTQIDDGNARDPASDFLLRAQQHLHNAVSAEPACALAYDAYARLLERAGADALAANTRVSYNHAYPDSTISTGYESVGESLRPQWQPQSNFHWPGKPPRILFLIHPAPHYGLDILYDGLCEALGDEQVVDWPWKGTLHGAAMTTLANYPCSFARRGTPLSYEQVYAALSAGEFDYVLVGDCECELPKEQMRGLVHLAISRGVPLVLLDQMDECIDMRPKVARHLGIEGFDLYIKREMAEFLSFDGNVVGLPFAFAKSKVRPSEGSRTLPLFWAGHRMFGLRRLHLEFLERRFAWDLSPTFAPEDYAQRMSQSRMGLCLYGKGYDTVRYWELPAHGVMLLAERPPLHIPHNFVDGESAVFFDNLKELEEKLAYYLEHPKEAAGIGQAGEEHYLRHHTSEARARQLLHAIYGLRTLGG